MAEGGRVPVRIFRHAQLPDSFVDRNGQDVDGNAAGADAHTGYGGFNFPLGFGVDGKVIMSRQGAAVYQRTDAVVEGAHIHAYAHAGQQRAGAGAGGVCYVQLIGGIDRNGIRLQGAAGNPAGHRCINIVYNDAAGHGAAEQTGRHADGG